MHCTAQKKFIGANFTNLQQMKHRNIPTCYTLQFVMLHIFMTDINIAVCGLDIDGKFEMIASSRDVDL